MSPYGILNSLNRNIYIIVVHPSLFNNLLLQVNDKDLAKELYKKYSAVSVVYFLDSYY